MTVVQRGVDHRPNPIRIAQHLIVPEANNAITFILNHSGPGQVHRSVVLPAIDLNHQFRAMTGEIGDEVTQRHLLAEMPVVEAFLQHTPELALRIRHLPPETACACDRAGWRMMLHGLALYADDHPAPTPPHQGEGLS